MAKGRLRRRLAAIDQNLSTRPDADLVDVLRIPEPFVSPTQRIIRRIIYALSALVLAVFIVYVLFQIDSNSPPPLRSCAGLFLSMWPMRP